VLWNDIEPGGHGDLLLGAGFVSADAINFLAREVRGLIFLALSAQRSEQLGLKLIPGRGESNLADAAMVSIEARAGVTTGISAADRAHTIRTAIDPLSGPSDFVEPGHVLPLRAHPGGLSCRCWSVEAAVDLAEGAGIPDATVLCTILGEDGGVADGDYLERFATQHDLRIVKVSEVAADHATRHRSNGAVELAGSMREVVGHLTSGAAVVTARREDGTPVRNTVGALSVASIRPPMILFCLDQGSETLATIRESRCFAVNIFDADQREPAAVPIPADALATVACSVTDIHTAGDHRIVVGEVHSVTRTGEELPGS
jgi:3,4-dihydroxy-2-butanone 4-phosphate synthase